ncbi:MAG: hypothetical protein AAB112_07460, partial [Thermodesulfobacteriota bacterium]
NVALKDPDFPVVEGRPYAFVTLLKAGTILLRFLEKSRLTRYTTTIMTTAVLPLSFRHSRMAPFLRYMMKSRFF